MGIERLDQVAVPAGGDDSLALQEKKQFSKNEWRQENKKAVLHWVFVGFTVVLAILGAAVVAVRILHFILPTSYCWLSDDKLRAIDQLFFEGTLGGVLVKFLEACYRRDSDKPN